MVFLVPCQDLGDLDLPVREDSHALPQYVDVLDVCVVLPPSLLHGREEEERTAVLRVHRLLVHL